MRSKLHTLPILEQWDCHHCTACCRETTIQLNADDLAKLQQQRWDQHPEFRGVQTVRRSLSLGGASVLAHKADGSCVFLTEAGLCRMARWSIDPGGVVEVQFGGTARAPIVDFGAAGDP